ncbi:MAG: MFS transporter [Gammaproteobacteria bacterium]|jgi:MFS family permease|uniref:MFS transporter n=1 Tax=Sinimarinibacterium sp. NLF-5-8 TaxID=2698684 RepID=UPI00137B95EB|nr:MFS transporter [Sinimarinibacterium sp. NLF-5-8]MDP1930485.1 MFS transporter [Gammaproteobacteria bacterium]MDP2348683.1 MFS transporter [Gammaproteobacteria bacterium]QHS08907.1 MFS transporter [Sinimarinibacterium sp. NLF-5-8]
MLGILRHTDFRRLLLAQMAALVGTGLATVALALLAYELAGSKAGAVLGTALAIKMTVYVLLAPVAGALVPPAKRKVVLISLDVIRASVVLALPFVTEIWQIYLLIAVLQAASAGFTPLFQSLIPEVLSEERDYTRALSLSRIAYDLENLFSPALAAILLVWISFHGLFVGTSFGFALSAGLIVTTVFPTTVAGNRREALGERMLRGMRIYLRTPRLRGLLALNLCAAAGGAMVFVNTIVIVRELLGGDEQQLALALAVFGGGSMLAALLLPKTLDRLPDRQVMLSSAIAMVVVLLTLTMLWVALPSLRGWAMLLPAWGLMGIAYAGLVTPGGRLIRRSAHNEDLPSVFAAQFSFSHVCWLLAYPLAGWVGLKLGLGVALAALSGLAVVGLLVAIRSWPSDDQCVRVHSHEDLPSDHPHFASHGVAPHAHPFVIDTLHRRWPG